jgi:hypothetical protein
MPGANRCPHAGGRHRGPRPPRVHRQPVVDAWRSPRRWRPPASTSSCRAFPGTAPRWTTCSATGWSDWTGRGRRRHHARLAERADPSWSPARAWADRSPCWAALHQSDISGLVCVNPSPCRPPRGDRDDRRVARRRPHGRPGHRESDIADPEVVEIGLRRHTDRPCARCSVDGCRPMAHRYGELTMPLRLFTSRQDHVVEPSNSEHLAPPTAARSSTRGSSAATTSPPRTTTAT